ncbi:acyl-CoA carboxylase epsilon subunit [Streptomyces decoyicus]
MSTSTDASTVIGEARPVGDGTSTEASTALGECPATDEGTAAGAGTVGTGGPGLGEPAPVGADACTDEGTAAGECTAVDDVVSPDGSTPPDALPASWLRIEKGHAEPEEIAAISVVLCAQLARLRALAERGPTEERLAGRRHHARHTACWSGCWSCG